MNAAGPWVMDVLDRVEGDAHQGPRAPREGQPHRRAARCTRRRHAYILQNPDKRVVFVIPYEGHFSLIGTTDVRGAPTSRARATITAEETDYLLDAANRFLAKPLARADVVSSYAGVRPLYDDGSAEPVGGHARLRAQGRPRGRQGAAALVFGGKITTYRCLAEEAMEKLAPFFPGLKGAWTGDRGAARRRRAALQPLPRRDARALSRARARAASRASCAATARARRRCSATRSALRRPRRALRRRPHRARGRVPARRGVGAHRRGRAVAAHQVRPAHDARRERAARGEASRCVEAARRVSRSRRAGRSAASSPTSTTR